MKELRYKLPTFTLQLHVKEPRNYRPVTIKTPGDLAIYLQPLVHSHTEQFVALHLNAAHQIIGLHRVSEGTLSSSLVHPREVFKAAIIANSYAIIVAHNHPSGAELKPSQEDLETTAQLLKAGKLLGINVIDHVIVGPTGKEFSIRENYPDYWRN